MLEYISFPIQVYVTMDHSHIFLSHIYDILVYETQITELESILKPVMTSVGELEDYWFPTLKFRLASLSYLRKPRHEYIPWDLQTHCARLRKLTCLLFNQSFRLVIHNI